MGPEGEEVAGGACSVEGGGEEEGVAAEVFMDAGVEAVGDHRGVGGEAEEATMTGEVGDAIDESLSYKWKPSASQLPQHSFNDYDRFIQNTKNEVF